MIFKSKNTDGHLNEEKYKRLDEKRDDFLTLLNAGYIKNIEHGWLLDFQSIYIDLFNMPMNINCGACIREGMERIWHKMEHFKNGNEQITENRKHGKPKKEF